MTETETETGDQNRRAALAKLYCAMGDLYEALDRTQDYYSFREETAGIRLRLLKIRSTLNELLDYIEGYSS